MGVPLNAVGFSSQIRDANGRTTLFEISDEDLASDPSYFGYLNSRGHFVIMQRTASTGAYRYFAGKGITTTYSAAWTARAALSGIDANYGYVTFDKIKFVP